MHAILDSINKAEEYILVEFYIIRPDGLGNRLKDALIAKVAEGVRFFVLYDGVGSAGLTQSYRQDLIAAGVKIEGFRTTRDLGIASASIFVIIGKL